MAGRISRRSICCLTGDPVTGRSNTFLWFGLLGALALYAYYNKVPAQAQQLISELGDKWTNLNPQMQAAALAVIGSLKAQGVLVGIPDTGGWRSVADQQAVPADDTNVVNPLDSYHVWGLAVDFVPLDALGNFNWPDASDPVWTTIGNAIKAAGLTWGGNFTTIKDMPHGELHLDTLADLQATYSDPMDYVTANAGGSLA